MRHLRSIRLAALLLAGAAAPAAARGQSATEVLQRVAERESARTQGIDDYTVEMRMLAGTFTIHADRRSPSSPFRLRYAGEGTLGTSMSSLAIADGILLALRDPDVTAARRNQLSARLVEGDSGKATYVVTATLPAPRARNGTQPIGFVAHYDTATLLPLRLEILSRGARGEVRRLVMDYANYRAVEGMQIPFYRRVVSLGARDDLPPAELERLRGTTEALRATLPQQTEAERARTELILEQVDGLLLRNQLVTHVVVTSAKTNQGPPSGVRLQRLDP